MNLSPLPIQKFFGNNGRPLAGGLLFTYEAGTSTKVATYIDSTGVTPNTNPIVLDFRGECRLWIDPELAYKFILAPPGDTDPPTHPIWTVDNITAAPQQRDNAAVDTGSVNNIAISIPWLNSIEVFTRVVFQAAHTNTGASTITVNGGTSHPLIWRNGGDLGGQAILEDGIYQAIFDGNNWQLQSPSLQAPQLRTEMEITTGVVPTNYAWPPGHAFRYMTDAQRQSVIDRDGLEDVTQALRDCLEANHQGDVFLPTGLYSITSSLLVYNQRIVGESKEYTTIVPDGDFAAFVNSGVEFITGSIGNFTIIYNNGVQPTNPIGNDNKIGILFEEVGGRSPNLFDVHDIEVRGAWWHYYDDSGSYACNITRCLARDCQAGFRKENGTTFVFDRAIGLNCQTGFYLENGDNFTLISCANDAADVTGGGTANEFISCVAFSIVGFDAESNTLTGNDSSLMRFNDCAGTIMGFSGHLNAFDENGGFIEMFKFIDSYVTISGIRPRRSAGPTELTMAGNGTFYMILATAASKILVSGSELYQPTTASGAPTYRTAFGTDTSQVQIVSTVYDAPLATNAAEIFVEFSEYTVTLTGLTTSPTGTLRWRNSCGNVSLQIPTVGATSNSTAMTFTPALPTEIRPARIQDVPVRLQDNGAAFVWGLLQIGTDGSLTFFPSPNGGTFTAAGTKGVAATTAVFALD